VSAAEQPDHDVLTVAEAASFLRMPAKTLYRLIDEGRVPHVRMTERRIRLLRSSLVAWLTGQERSPRDRKVR
jgi:excisionase family DNA binding protein